MPTNFATRTPTSPCHHTFLMSEGRWLLKGHILLPSREQLLPVQGKLMVVWHSEEWFSIVGKLMSQESTVADSNAPTELTLQYRGRISTAEQRYTYVLQHSHHGHIEGEGWLMPRSILHRFWLLGDAERRTGLEHFHQMDDHYYYWSSSIMTGHALVSTLEATLERC